MTPKTGDSPAAAPSVASDRVKQSASLAMRTGRSSRAARSWCRAVPMSQVELAFFNRPVAGSMAPGVATPTRAGAEATASRSWTSPATAAMVPA